MSLAPSFSPPCFHSYSHHIHQPHQASFASERRRRVTLLHAQKQPQPPVADLPSPAKTKKTVRFDDRLESVRLFLKTQRPSAIRDGDPSLAVGLKFPNWPTKTTLMMRRQHQSVIRMEGVQVAADDQSTLVGRCRVANLAFEKHVLVRYTTDDWQSFHETEAMYREPIGSLANTWDRFTFAIPLDEPTHSTLYLALRYAVNERDYWDNNDGANYQIDVIPTATTTALTTTITPTPTAPTTITTATASSHTASSLSPSASSASPSSPSPAPPLSPSARPQQQQPQTVDTAVVAVTTAHTHSLAEQPQPERREMQGQQRKKLGHRYDFGASLSQAKKIPYDLVSSSPEPMHFSSFKHGGDSEGLQASYHDFVNKYCFYGNTYAPASPALPSSEPICG